MAEEPALGLFPPAKCCSGCGTPWEKWCRGCNLVYCVQHAEPKVHVCRSLAEPPKAEPEPPPAAKPSPAPEPLVVPIKPRGRKKKEQPPDPQQELPLKQ
jgi:hypothetical protein